jgi:hypothetical protein
MLRVLRAVKLAETAPALKPGAKLVMAPVADADAAIPQIRDFVAAQLGRDPSKLDVSRGPGKNRDPVYLVRENGKAVGVFKVFVDPKLADVEIDMLARLKKVKTLAPVEVRGTAEVEWKNSKGEVTAQRAVFMEMVDRHSAGRQLVKAPTSGPEREAALAAAERDIKLIGAGLADFHKGFATGKQVSPELKKQVIDGLIVPGAGGKSKFDQAIGNWPGLKRELEPLLGRFKNELFPLFEKVELPETAFHADATSYNFSVGSDGRARVYDVGTMRFGFSDKGLPTGTAAFDIGRYLQSLPSLEIANTHTVLNAAEASRMQRAFLGAYKKKGNYTPAMQGAVRFTRAEFELAAIRFAKSQPEAGRAMQRLKSVLDGE